jgi:CheY-like chemotaxis protein
MNALRVLHVDDEPDIREVVEMSLSLDPVFTVRSCASGRDALKEVDEWQPDVILCDVMMPAMDGPTTLARLRDNPKTAKIPVIFMTARAQARELEHFKSLGAAGVIPKPFDPMTLADSVRSQLRLAGMAALREGFLQRLRSDAAMLAKCQDALAKDGDSAPTHEEIKAFAHALAGAAGIFGCHEVGERAAALNRTIAQRRNQTDQPGTVERALERLLASMAKVQS